MPTGATYSKDFDLAQDAARLVPAVEAGLTRWGLEIEADIVQEINRMGLSFEGTLRQSVTHQTERTEGGVALEVGPGTEYAYYVHEGRRPGKMPPVAKLEPWVRKKLGIAQPESRSVAFLVARKIGRKGTKGQPFMDKASADVQQTAPARVQRIVDDALDAT